MALPRKGYLAEKNVIKEFWTDLPCFCVTCKDIMKSYEIESISVSENYEIESISISEVSEIISENMEHPVQLFKDK